MTKSIDAFDIVFMHFFYTIDVTYIKTAVTILLFFSFGKGHNQNNKNNTIWTINWSNLIFVLFCFEFIKELLSFSIQEAHYLRLETSQTYQIALYPKTSCIKLQRVPILSLSLCVSYHMSIWQRGVMRKKKVSHAWHACTIVIDKAKRKNYGSHAVFKLRKKTLFWESIERIEQSKQLALLSFEFCRSISECLTLKRTLTHLFIYLFIYVNFYCLLWQNIECKNRTIRSTWCETQQGMPF